MFRLAAEKGDHNYRGKKYCLCYSIRIYSYLYLSKNRNIETTLVQKCGIYINFIQSVAHTKAHTFVNWTENVNQ